MPPPPCLEYVVDLPREGPGTFLLRRARVPACALAGVDTQGLHPCVDGLVLVDIVVDGGVFASIQASGGEADALERLDRRKRPRKVGKLHGEQQANAKSPAWPSNGHSSPPSLQVDLRGGMALPVFADLHTHVDKGHTCERMRNADGSLSCADASTAADAPLWTQAELEARMEFGLRCAHAHGTAALRTHLINMTPRQTELTWRAFEALRARWRGRVELQGVALVPLSFFRDAAAAQALAFKVKEHGGVLGAAVCCGDRGGFAEDEFTTCAADRSELLDRMFGLAREMDLDLDFHADENGNRQARGLLDIALKTVQHKWQGRVVVGHVCSLAEQPQDRMRETLRAAREARLTVVSLPLVNQWTQDRARGGGGLGDERAGAPGVGGRGEGGVDGKGDEDGRKSRDGCSWPEQAENAPACSAYSLSTLRTPRRRGVTALQELQAAGVACALASDNTRDQFYAYGDLDMLEVLAQGARSAHLDRPLGRWVLAAGQTPARAMRLPGREGLCELRLGGPADFVIFRARSYSELFSRPQADRVVVRGGRPLYLQPPLYEELDWTLEARGEEGERDFEALQEGGEGSCGAGLGVGGALTERGGLSV